MMGGDGWANLTHQVNHLPLMGRGQEHRLRDGLEVPSCISKETEIPTLWVEAKRQGKGKETPAPHP